MAKVQKYDGLSTSELARLTRERGLDKPAVGDSGAWAAWLREQDAAPGRIVDALAQAAPVKDAAPVAPKKAKASK